MLNAILWGWDAEGIHVLQLLNMLPAVHQVAVMLDSCNGFIVYLPSALVASNKKTSHHSPRPSAMQRHHSVNHSGPALCGQSDKDQPVMMYRCNLQLAASVRAGPRHFSGWEGFLDD